MTHDLSVSESESQGWQELIEAGHEAYAAGKYPQAEVHFADALKQAEGFGEDDLRLARTLGNLAGAYQVQGKFAFAEEHYQRSLAIKRRIFGDEHIEVAVDLHNLAILNSARRKQAEAESYYRQSLAMREKLLGANHKDLAGVLKNYARLLRGLKRNEEATLLELRVKDIEQ